MLWVWVFVGGCCFWGGGWMDGCVMTTYIHIPTDQSTKPIYIYLHPHRYPFLLVDKVVEFDAGKRAVGIKQVRWRWPPHVSPPPGRGMWLGGVV